MTFSCWRNKAINVIADQSDKFSQSLFVAPVSSEEGLHVRLVDPIDEFRAACMGYLKRIS